MQLTPDASGLFDDSNNAISIGTVVSGITKLRDNLAGTAAENALTRNTVSVNGVAPTPGPDLFAADSNAVAFARTPSQVSCTTSKNLCRVGCAYTIQHNIRLCTTGSAVSAEVCMTKCCAGNADSGHCHVQPVLWKSHQGWLPS